MKVKSFEDLYIDQLKDLYSAEKQLVQALPKMAKAATTPELRQGFEEHLQQTKQQMERLDEIFARLETKSGGKKCKGMEGLIEEGKEAIDLETEPMIRDAALIAAAQRVEHYEIAGYGTARTFAEQLGFDDDRALLQQTLEEEEQTDQRLTALATGGMMSAGINEEAMEQPVKAGRR
jgi:ferritin-like metal-binding protein YciE